MSGAFVKEQDSDQRDELAERPISEHSNDVTVASHAQIEQALTTAGEACTDELAAGGGGECV